MDKKQLANKLHTLVEGEVLDLLLDEITKDIALEIVNTTLQQNDKREELYLLCEAVKKLKGKLQEYDNTYNSNFD